MLVLRQFRKLFLPVAIMAIAGLLLAGGTFSHGSAAHDHEHTEETQIAAHHHVHSGPFDITANDAGDIHCGGDILIDVFDRSCSGNQVLTAYHSDRAVLFECQFAYIEPPPPKRLS